MGGCCAKGDHGKQQAGVELEASQSSQLKEMKDQVEENEDDIYQLNKKIKKLDDKLVTDDTFQKFEHEMYHFETDSKRDFSKLYDKIGDLDRQSETMVSMLNTINTTCNGAITRLGQLETSMTDNMRAINRLEIRQERLSDRMEHQIRTQG